MTRHEQIEQAITIWEGITANPHHLGGTEFNLGKVEIGHIHGSAMVDIPFTVKIRERLVADGEAQPHHLLAESGWISFYLHQDDDVNQAIKLLRISYLRKRLRRASADERQQINQEIEHLDISPALKNTLRNPSARDNDAEMPYR